MSRPVLCSLLFCLAACAMSPQNINIDPVLEPAAVKASTDYNAFNLLVRDERDTNILGSRGGPYAKSAVLKTREDISDKLYAVLSDAFTSAGFQLDAEATNQLIVSVTGLAYESEGENRVSAVRIRVVVKATVATINNVYTKQYKASHRTEVFMAPDAGTNNKMVNDVLGAVVQRVLDDEELLVYLQN